MQYRCNRYYSIEDILGIWASLLRAFPDPRNVGFEQRAVAEGMIINVGEVMQRRKFVCWKRLFLRRLDVLDREVRTGSCR